MRYVRIYAEATADNSDIPPLWIDAIVDEEDEILGSHALFGFQGWFERSDVHFEPFVINSKGRIDWGDGFDAHPNDRFGWLDIRAAPLKLGRILTLRTDNYGQKLYRVAKMISLPAG